MRALFFLKEYILSKIYYKYELTIKEDFKMLNKIRKALKYAKQHKKEIVKIAILLVAPGGLFVIGAMLVKKLASKMV